MSVGQHPARFEIQKMRLLYLKYILLQDEESLISKFLQLQLEQPTKGDWASTCLYDLKELQMNLTLEDIKLMSEQKFRNMLKSKVKESAFRYLKDKQGSNGKENI